jgi:hypothetical protein
VTGRSSSGTNAIGAIDAVVELARAFSALPSGVADNNATASVTCKRLTFLLHPPSAVRCEAAGVLRTNERRTC